MNVHGVLENSVVPAEAVQETSRMKAAFLLVALGFVVISCTAQAVIVSSEVKPDNLNDFPVSFDIHSSPLPNGGVQFIIKVSEKELKFPSQVDGGLSIMKITQSSESGHPIPGDQGNRVKEERRGNSITFTFAVTKRELRDPDFCFVFSVGVEAMIDGKLVPMPDADVYYARLKHFMPK